MDFECRQERFDLTKMLQSKEDTPWSQYEGLLAEAAIKNNYQGLVKLLENESKIEYHYIFKQKCYLPLQMAIKNQNVPMINLFCNYGYKMPELDENGKNWSIEDSYDDAQKQLHIMEALTNPVWISMTAEDPFMTVFRLSKVIRTIQNCTDSFQKEYDEMYKRIGQYGAALLDKISTREEGEALMRCKTVAEKSEFRQLDFINIALQSDQKEIIAHSLMQHFLTKTVFGDIPYWRTSGLAYKLSLSVLIGFLFPITTLLNIILPSSVFPNLASHATKPYVKFINGMVSYLTYLIALSGYCASDYGGIRKGEHPTALELLIFVFLLGFGFGECKQLCRGGIKHYFSNRWNWVDIGMNLLMLFSITTWITLYHLDPYEGETAKRGFEALRYVTDFAFAVAVVLSFFRVLYICQISSHLGLIQVSIGEMILVIMQFTFICAIVLISFSVGMVYLSNATPEYRKIKVELEKEYKESSTIYAVFQEHFDGFFSTLATMAYVSLTLKDTDALDLFHDGSLVELWANIMFVLYFGISMIVLLNVLIAMMNSSYQVIADNKQTWFLNSRARLWMEYIGNEQTRPVPFNLIPTVDKLIKCARMICAHKQNKDNSEIAAKEREEKKKYKKLCKILTEKYLCKLSKSCKYAESLHSETEGQDDPFLQRIENRCQEWNESSRASSSVVFDNPSYGEEVEMRHQIVQMIATV